MDLSHCKRNTVNSLMKVDAGPGRLLTKLSVAKRFAPSGMNQPRTMQIDWTAGDGASGLSQGWARFGRPALDAYRWPIVEIRGVSPGPRLCVMAGVHINETSSIQAAMELWQDFPPDRLAGSVSVLPIVNQPALYRFTKAVVPVDGLNLHFSFPGDPDGSFSEVLAHALLHDWAADADMVIDLHGGDFGEEMARYVVYQTMGTAAFDQRAGAVAHAFGADLVVGLPPDEATRRGRCCTALAPLGRPALVSEAGDNGCLSLADVAWHRRGVRSVAGHMGMLDGVRPPTRAPEIDRYLWVTAPSAGLVYPQVTAGQQVRAGQLLAELRDPFQSVIETVHAPEGGYVMFRTTLSFVEAGGLVAGIGAIRGG